MNWTKTLFRRWNKSLSESRPDSFRPALELLEAREVPTTGITFLQGYAFVDLNLDGIYNTGDTAKVGATITLSRDGALPISAVTDASGYYRFSDLIPGATYTLTETDAVGFNSRQVNPSTVLSTVAQVNSDSVTVTLGVDAGNLSFVRTGGPIAAVPGTAYTFTNGPLNAYTSQPSSSNSHQYQGFVARPDALSGIVTYCVDLFHANPATYAVVTSNSPFHPPESGLPPTTLENIGRIAYLYNTYGRHPFSGADAGVQEAALGIALYELVYDSSVDLNSGNFQIVSSNPALVTAAANAFLAESAGKNQSVLFLNVERPGDQPPSFSNSQGMLATEMFNFANSPPAPTARLGDFVWEDTNRNGVQDLGELGINGVVVTLFTETDGGLIPIRSTFTGANPGNPAQNGYYQFANLMPGERYVVCFTTPDGFTRTAQFAGTDSALDSNMDIITGCAPAVVLAPGESNQTIDAGFYRMPVSAIGRIAGTVFSDCNGNGIQDVGESGILGVTMTLNGPSGVRQATTDTQGSYAFTDLLVGTYSLSETQPAGFNQGVNTPGTPPNGVVSGDVITGIVIGTGALVGYNFGESITAAALDLRLTKTADRTTYAPGESATFTYTVTNNSRVVMTGVRVVDDNATPGQVADDFVVAENLTLAAGETRTFQAIRPLPVNLIQVVDGVSLDAGSLTVERLASGDYRVTYVQSEANGNDSRYGTGAVPAAGWSKSRGFSSLVGSDQASFQFTDGSGRVVLEFAVDTISAATSATFPSGIVSYPSGYGTLGATGGEGRIFVGSASHILSATTAITENLKRYPTGYLVNSPAETTPGSGVSADPNAPNWDYKNSFTVVVSQAAFGAAGLGGVRITDIHNSPGKNGITRGPGEPVATTLTNIATGTVTSCGVTAIASASATVQIQGTPPTTGGVDICSAGEKPQTLVMEFTDGQAAISNTQSGKAQLVGGGAFTDSTVRIVVSDKSNPNDSKAKVFFSGTVSRGHTFALSSAAAGESRLPSDTYVHLFSSTGQLLQSVKFHTSCSQPLKLGDQFGAVKLTGYVGEKGATLGAAPPVAAAADIAVRNLVASGNKIQLTLTNSGLGFATIESMLVDWASSSRKLKKIKLDGVTLYDSGTSPTRVTINNWKVEASARQLAPGQSAVLEFEFESTANLATFGLTIGFTGFSIVAK